jgi:hypothetical protein
MKKVLGLSVVLAGLAAAPAFADCGRDIDRIGNSNAPISPDARQHLRMADQAYRRGDEATCQRELDAVAADIRAADRQGTRGYDRSYSDRRSDNYDRRYDDRGSSGSSSSPLGRLLDNLGR